jgi:sugar-specific transcriptional regulator TrmB
LTLVYRSSAWSGLGEEPVRKILKTVGLTEKETDVYIFLAKHGALKGIDIAKLTRIDRAEVYRILKSLQSKGLLESTLEAPARFVTTPLDKVVDGFVKARRDEAASIENAKQELMNDWTKIIRLGLKQNAEKFVVFEGNDKIYPRIFQMIKETKSQLSATSSISDLVHAAKFGLFEAYLEHPQRPNIRFRVLTEFSEKETNTIKNLLKRIPIIGQSFEGRSPNLGLHLIPRMVIRDQEEILFFITPQQEKSAETDQTDTCLLTNCKALVQSFTSIFEEMWLHSTEIQKRIQEIETGKPPTTRTIYDAEIVLKKYDETLAAAKEEVIMMTSRKGMTQIRGKTPLFKELVEKNVSIKIIKLDTVLALNLRRPSWTDNTFSNSRTLHQRP